MVWVRVGVPIAHVMIFPKEKLLTRFTLSDVEASPFYETCSSRYDRMHSKIHIVGNIGEGKPAPPESGIVQCERVAEGGFMVKVAQKTEKTLMPAKRKAKLHTRDETIRYRSILENMNDGCFEVDLAGSFTFFNDAVCRAIGYSRKDLMGMNYRRFTDPENATQVYQAFHSVYVTGNSIKSFGFEITDKEGEKRYLEGSISLCKDSSGVPTGFLGIVNDVTEKKRAEEEVRAEEMRFHILAEQSSDIILLVNRDGVIIYENHAMEKNLGFKLESRIGHKIFDHIHSEDLCFIEKVFNSLFKEGYERIQRDEIRIRDVNGNWHVFEAVASPLKRRNVVDALVVNLRDITQRKNAEQMLAQSEAKYRLLADHMKDHVWLTDLNFRLSYVSPSVEKLMGYSLSELKKMPVDQIVTPESYQTVLDFIEMEMPRALAAPANYSLKRFLDVELTCKNGERVWFEYTFTFIRDDEGKPTAILGEGRNITDRKQAQEALKKSEDIYRVVAENIRDVIWTFDYKTGSAFVSPSVKFLRGYSSEEVLHQTLDQILTPESFNRLVEILNRELFLEMNGECHGPEWSYTTELEMFCKDGKTVWTEAIINFFYDELGEPKGITGITRNISDRKQVDEERKRLQERLQRAEKMEALGTLAGGVAHDLNNVLGILVGFSELLSEKLPQDSPLKRYAENIMTSSMRGAAIIEDLLTLARRGVNIAEVVNLGKVVSDYFVSPEFEKLQSLHPNLTIRAELDKDLLNIKGSPVHLGKTVMNLVLNAAEAISDCGEVTLRAENRYLDQPVRGYDEIQEGDYVVLTVSDTGSGISCKDLPKIFEPFYTKKVMGISGTGLGLAVVWGTVKDHHGYIDVQSEEGKGSIFTLYFPATREDVASPRESASFSTFLGDGESILVVDDVPAQRELAVNMLERLGYRVEAVSCGEDAVGHVKNKKVDLLVLDMIMDPGIDGLETYRRISAIHPGQKAVIVSGFSETDRVGQAQKMGAGAFVRKPYILEKMGLAVRRELDRK